MVEKHINEKTGQSQIILQPNNSASWQFNLVILGLVTFFLTVICVHFALLGLWLVFPFAGLEVIALFICFYLRVRANHSKEVITFDDSYVLIERGRDNVEESWKYHRPWTRVFVREKARGHLKQVFIRAHGKELELGSFLNKQDKEILIKDLKDAVYT